MKSSVKDYLNNNFMKCTILKTILWSFVFFVIFTCIVFLLAFISLKDSVETNIKLEGNVSENYVNTYLNNKITSLNFISKNTNTQSFLSDSSNLSAEDCLKTKEYSQLSKNLEFLCNSDDAITNVWTSNDNIMFSYSSADRFSEDSFSIDSQLWNNKFIKSSYWISPVKRNNDNGMQYVSIVTTVVKNHNVIGYCGIDIDFSSICDYMSASGSDTINTVIVSEYGELIYTPSNKKFTDNYDFLSYPLNNLIAQAPSSNTDVEGFSFNNKQYYMYSNESIIDGWHILVLFDSPVNYSESFTLFIKQYAITICLVVAILVILVSVLRSNTKDLKEIQKSIENINSDNYSYRINSENDGEIAEISRVIDNMSAEIEKSRLEISNHILFDSLTKIPNRFSLYKTLDEMIENSEKSENRFAMLFVDMDNFKWMNETLGHKFGDECLERFAQILSDTLKGVASVFRFSGDEFVIIAQFDKSFDTVNEIISKINVAFDQPITICNDKIFMRFSIGVAVYPDDDITSDLLLRDADIALHRAKQNGKDRVSYYNNVEKTDILSSATIATQLTTALSNSELILNYQPIINLQNGEIHGFEVLVRWNSSQYGLIPPTDFIKVAEEAGSIVQIGTWIFESGCRFLKSMCDKFNLDDIIMSINVSPVQLKREDYLDHVKRVLEITQLNPKNIQIEITESILLDFTDNENTVLDKIHEMGIKLAIDDFGTGYASMNYVKSYPFNTLKVDKSFIDKIYENNKDYAITDSIIDLVHNLGIATVAEGVETVSQYNFLKKMKCDYVQGFLVSKPLDEKATIEFIENYDAFHRPTDENLYKMEKQIAEENIEKTKYKDIAKSSAQQKGFINQPDSFLTHNT